MEERIDIYNVDRTLSGKTVARADAFLHEGEYMLYVLAIIQDTHNRYLIVQRALDKKWAAGKWEIPGGGVLAGEASAEAIVREMLEEVAVDVSQQPLVPIYSYENVDLARGDNYFVDIYSFKLDVAPEDIVLQESEAIDFQFASWEEICALEEQGQFLHFKRLQEALGVAQSYKGVQS